MKKKLFRNFLLALLAVGLMLGYVWMRMVNNNLTEKVAALQQEVDILETRLEREQLDLNKELMVIHLEPRARSLGLFYPWEGHGSN